MKQARWLDISIRIALVLVVALGAYLGYSVWSHKRQVEASSPAYRALNNIRAYVKKHPNEALGRVNYAQALIAVGKPNDALEQYSEALKIDKKNVPALMGIGLLAIQQKQYKTAEGNWRKVIDQLSGATMAEKDSRLEQAYFYLGQTLIEEGKYEDAVGYLKEAQRMRPDASDTHYSLAVAYRDLGTTKKQEQELETTLAFDPNMPEANYDLGQLLLKRGDIADAAERFRLAADKAPRGVEMPADALARLGNADDRLAKAKKLQSSDPKAALVQARIAAALSPTRNDVALLVADLYTKTGDTKKAKDLYQSILDRDADNAAAKEGIARLTRGK